MSEQTPIVALTGGDPHAWIMINALRERFGDFPVIQEAGEPSAKFWKRRAKLLGPLKVASMQAARIPIKFTKRGTETIIADMIDECDLNPEPVSTQTIHHVSTVNDQETLQYLKQYNPKVVFVASAGMLRKKTLNAIDAPFVNYHSGINPAYRGMFGGYFALANGEPEYFGATVHLVDEGVDTGDTLYQSQVDVKPGDNFHTYIWRIAAGSRNIVVRAIGDALNDDLRPYKVEMSSKQYFAPTFGEYIFTGLMKGVW